MTHRSPLVTLAGLIIAFAVMFGVNLASSAPAGSYSGGPSPQPSAAVTTPVPSETPSATLSPSATASPSPIASPRPSPTPTVTEKGTKRSEFPARVVYAGRTSDGSAAIAVAVLGDRVAAYLCDGHNVESWMRGSVEGDELTLRSRAGARLEAELDGRRLRGQIKVDGQRLEFVIREAAKPAGLYRAKNSKVTIGWIVLPDGSQVGIQTSGSKSSSAPTLDPAKPQVTVDGDQLDAASVTGDTEL